MKYKNFSFLFPLFAVTILIFGLSTQIFDIPPLATLLDPFVGAVQNENETLLNAKKITIGKNMTDYPVTIYFDNRKVPHIYARTNKDLYFAQGYVTAYLRLWQMDFMTRVGSGRLSEIFNKPFFLDYDRAQRRLGLLEAAKTSLAFIEKNPETSNVISAYTAGINAYVKQLHNKDIPFEYKLMDYQPEPWSNLKTVLIMKLMGNTLGGYEEDTSMSRMILALGEERFNELFPDYQPHLAPIVQDKTNSLAKDLKTTKPNYLDYSFLSLSGVVEKSSYNPKLGSNSWAISGHKTKSGFPILANDPHLSLSFPCFWVEMQLVSPEMNVYGVSIPGTPSVIIGFNQNVAWGITNGADDVKDWYKIKLTSDYKKYEMNGKWLNMSSRIEEIKRKAGKPVYDTIYSTVHGPIVIDQSFQLGHKELLNYAMKWELQVPSNEFLTFILLNKAKNYGQYRQAIKGYSFPGLNFTFISKSDTISVNHQAKMRIKQPGQGRFVLDGSKSDEISSRYIPSDSLPHLLNPGSNYVFSANQHPTNSGYRYYYNGYYSESRANRINQLLKNGNNFDVPAVEKMQLDNTGYFAAIAAPVLRKVIDVGQLDAAGRKLLSRFHNWQGTFDSNDEQAELFKLWWEHITELTWDELKTYPFYLRAPDDYILLDLVNKKPSDAFFDIQGTAKIEKASDIVTQAFIQTVADLNKPDNRSKKRWSDFNRTNIMHLSNLAALSMTDIPSAGQPDAINAVSKNWGPSWRMVVELGDRPNAYGIFPGGQSGNVGSKYYNNNVVDWLNGKYYKLQYYMTKEEALKNTDVSWSFK